jgi:hypothetical protein
MKRIGFTAVAVLVLSSAATRPALAQANGGLGGLLLRFFSTSNPVVLAENPNPALSHAAHFVSQDNARDTMRQINAGIAAQIATFPVGSSSGGFAFTFDESLGVYNRTTESFGPIFAERPLTAGKGKFSFAVNYQHGTWDSLEGFDLGAGEIPLYLQHEDTNRDGRTTSLWFEGDLIRADFSLDLKTDTTVLFANYGLAERLDVGVAVPFQRVDMNARIATSIQRLSTSPDPFVVHQFEDGSSEHTYLESGTASGIGDVLVRAKWNFYRGGSAGLAAGTDLRLPTGDEEDLLGSGATQAKVYLVAAAARSGRFSPRASFGYTFSSGGSDYTGDLPDELNYTAGFDLVAHKRLTIAADFLGRTLLDAQRLVLENVTYDYAQRTDPTVRQATFATPTSITGNMGLYLASVGFKLNPFGRLLLVGNVLFSLGDDGLQDDVTPVFGLDYTF